MKPEQKFLNSKKAAQYIQAQGLLCSANYLKKLRSVGGGNDFSRWGSRVVYSTEALDRWIESRLSGPCRNTVEARA